MEEDKTKEKDITLDLFGVDKELVEKSMDIRPTLDLGELEDGEVITLEFIENEPKVIKTPNSKFQKEAKVISVKDGEGLEYSMFLSSKTLALGIAKLYKQNNDSLKGVKAKIKKGKANYKEFGENVCYTVQQVKKTTQEE